MTSRQKDLLLLVGVVAVAAFIVSPFSPVPGTKMPPGSAGDAVWRQGYPVGHEHLCMPGDIDGGPLAGPHPLYARPNRAGHNRTGLIQCGGWDWILNPPTEVTVP